MGIVDVAALAARTVCGLERDNEIDLVSYKVSRCDAGRVLICEIPEVESDIPSFFISSSLQAFAQSIERRRDVVETYVKEANAPDFSRLLRVGGERRGEERADRC